MRFLLTNPAPGKSVLATVHHVTVLITGTLQTTNAPWMPDHFPPTCIPLLQPQPKDNS